ncbi:MAG: sensor histidine kinase [Methylovirgula sp.]
MNFALCGLALLALTCAANRWKWLSGALALPIALISLVAVLGYLFGAEEFYTLASKVTGLAAPTSVAFLLSGSGIIAAQIDCSYLRWLASPHSGGVMLRRLLPLATVLPAGLVWLGQKGQAAGVFSSSQFGAAAVVVGVIFSASVSLLWCAALLDRLDRRHMAAEEQVQQLNIALLNRLNALQVANKELEGFSYAASHVFLTPLRAIDGFSRILLDEYADKLDSEGKRLLGVVRSSALDVHELVDETLGFLRFGRDDLSADLIDMAALVRSALKQLEPKTGGRKLKIEMQPLPAAWGDASMIEHVWANLLDNAIRFTAPKPEARIEVGATPGANETVYYVRDNGVGFDMQYVDKLFGVFSRLHGAELAGNGMGLAIVRRLVTRHGGRVWAESKLGEGATFYFALPTKETGDA